MGQLWSENFPKNRRKGPGQLFKCGQTFTGKLVHWHHDTWQWQHADPFLEYGYVTFYFDADHKISGFKIDQHSPDFHFYKLDFVRD